MQGARIARASKRGPRFAGPVIAACATLVLAAPSAHGFVSSTVDDGRLVARSDRAADIIKVSCGADLRVKVNGLDPRGGAAPCASIRGVRVLGRGGADTINVTRVGPRNGFTHRALRRRQRVRALGGASADRISGSRLSDLLAGGRGHDVLRGRRGADRLRGDRGSDLILGGRGGDRLRGGRGRDRLRGGRGNDVEIDL